MIWQARLKKSLAWVASVPLIVGAFFFPDAWVMLAPKILGLPGAILVVGLIATCLAWITTYAITSSHVNEKISNWVAKKEGKFSDKIQRYLKRSKIIAVIAVNLTVGPEVVPFLLFALGIKGKQVYLYSVACGFLFSSVWCSIYAGAWWSIIKAFHFVVNGR